MDDIKKLNTPSPYNGPKPQDAIPDIFIQDSFSKDDERLWVPLASVSYTHLTLPTTCHV